MPTGLTTTFTRSKFGTDETNILKCYNNVYYHNNPAEWKHGLVNFAIIKVQI